AITSDLVFASPDRSISSRARKALWTLAVADGSVKSCFVLALEKSPDRLRRIASGFIQVSRALGLFWPSGTEAGILFDPAVKGLQNVAGTNIFNMPELNALAEKLTEEQRTQALDRILLQLAQANGVSALQGAAQGLQALAPKVTETRARQAVLLQIGQTS